MDLAPPPNDTVDSRDWPRATIGQGLALLIQLGPIVSSLAVEEPGQRVFIETSDSEELLDRVVLWDTIRHNEKVPVAARIAGKCGRSQVDRAGCWRGASARVEHDLMMCQEMAKRTDRAKRPREILAPQGHFHPRAC